MFEKEDSVQTKLERPRLVVLIKNISWPSQDRDEFNLASIGLALSITIEGRFEHEVFSSCSLLTFDHLEESGQCSL